MALNPNPFTPTPHAPHPEPLNTKSYAFDPSWQDINPYTLSPNP